MNTMQINHILKTNKHTKHIFQNVCAKDQITLPKTDPAAYVINLDDSDGPGTHWIAVYINQQQRESNYFDSLAQSPIPETLPLLNLTDNIKTNTHKLQDHTMVCGQFTILFIMLRAQGKTFKQTIDFLKHPSNDQIIHSLFQPIFPTLPFYPNNINSLDTFDSCK